MPVLGPEWLLMGGAALMGVAGIGIYVSSRGSKAAASAAPAPLGAPVPSVTPASASVGAAVAGPPAPLDSEEEVHLLRTFQRPEAPPAPATEEKKPPSGKARVLGTPPPLGSSIPPIGSALPSRLGGVASGGGRLPKKAGKKLEDHHPATLGKYQLLETLGEGGMATVFHARDTASGKDVAIKLIHENLLGDPEFLGRFEREMKVTRALVHPNIVQVFNVGEQEGKQYMVMELMDGGGLDIVTPPEGMEPSDMLKLAIQIASGLHYAHERGLIHRDIKPSNVMTNAKGVPKILDFGLALGQGMSRFTQVGMAMGTPTHMAPEVLTTGNADGKSDQYSLGIVFYEMLVGKPPFEGEDAMQIGLQHVKMPPPSIRVNKPSVPAALESIIMKMLAKKPDDRYATMAEVRDQLETVQL